MLLISIPVEVEEELKLMTKFLFFFEIPVMSLLKPTKT